MAKISMTYSTRVRKSENIEIRLQYKKQNAKFISNITMADSYLDNGNVRYETKLNKFNALRFNFYMLINSKEKANNFLDKLFEKAKVRLKGRRK